jgi:hypothetical protein
MLFKSTPLLLLGLSLQTSFAALVNLRLPVDGKWANFVKDTAPAATGSGPALDGWLIYPEGSAGAPNKPWTLRNRVALQLDDPADAPFIESDYGLTSGAPAPGTGGSGWWIFEAASPAALVDISAALMEDTRLNQVHFLLYRQMKRRFLPNDTLFTQQWHLRNTGQGGGTAGLDVNVVPVWDAWKGTGKRIAIVDDGLQTSHPDLAPNVDTVNDHDWNDATPDDPSPDITVDHHGTSCAGVAAARGNNGLGVSGAAPEATLVGPVHVGVPYLGFRIWPRLVRLDAARVRRLRRRLRTLARLRERHALDDDGAQRRAGSVLAWASHADTLQLRKRIAADWLDEGKPRHLA